VSLILLRIYINKLDNLRKRGWTGSISCCFCSNDESVDHLMVLCLFVQTVWFWMGICQNLSPYRYSFDDVMIYAQALPYKEKCAFLTILSAVCWSLWKCRNDIVFNDKHVGSNRNLLIVICSLLHYWSGLGKKDVQGLMKRWMPEDLNMIPLQALPPVLCLDA
jgi:zinc-binding in reverse transcriptase